MCVRVRFAVIAACAVLGTACGPSMPSPEDMVAGANALDAEYIAAINRGDVEAVADTYWRDPRVASIGISGFGAEGWEAVHDALAQALAGMNGASLEFASQHNIPVGDVVVGWGTIRVTMPGGGGTSQETLVRYTCVKGMRDGRWVYLADHGSVAVPTPSEG